MTASALLFYIGLFLGLRILAGVIYTVIRTRMPVQQALGADKPQVSVVADSQGYGR